MLTTDNPAMKELLDDMSDGQWHPINKITKRNARFFKDKTELEATVHNLTKNGVFITGANNSFRMTKDELLSWRTRNDMSLQATPKDMNAPRFFGGILEDDGWTSAPLRLIDVVHCHANETTADIIKDAVGMHGMTFYNFEGLVRVFTLNGKYVNEILKELKEDRPELNISGIRTDKDSKRRELCDLPRGFVPDLCEFYGVFAHALIRQSMSSVKHHIAERDDIQQQIYMWIIDAIQRYDNETSIPFAAYLHSAMNRWVHDLPRKAFGRAVADSELQISRLKTEFINKNNRKPTVDELSELLGGNKAKSKKKIIDVTNASFLREPSSIHREESDDIPLEAVESAEKSMHDEVENSILSASLVSSVQNVAHGPDIISWCDIYERTWGEQMGSDKISDNEKIVMKEMSKYLSDAA